MNFRFASFKYDLALETAFRIRKKERYSERSVQIIRGRINVIEQKYCEREEKQGSSLKLKKKLFMLERITKLDPGKVSIEERKVVARRWQVCKSF